MTSTLPMWSNPEALGLLKLMAQLDPRNTLYGPPEDQAAKAQTWADELTRHGVPREWAETWVRRHPPAADQRQLYLGDVTRAWHTESERAEQAAARGRLVDETPVLVDPERVRHIRAVLRHDMNVGAQLQEAGQRLPARSAESLEAAISAAAAGEPIPAPVGADWSGVWALPASVRDRADYEQSLADEFPSHDAADIRARACSNRRMCACDHTKCRGGFLDGDQVVMIHGRQYIRTLRCPHCEDAAKMIGENTARRGRR